MFDLFFVASVHVLETQLNDYKIVGFLLVEII